MNITADAVAREATWLNTIGDGLPDLAAPTGPWGLIQAYQPRVPAKRKTSIYVTRTAFHIKRFANVRSMPTYMFHLKVVWPLSSGSGSEEADAAALDSALDLLVQRIAGFTGDHTHGGRFLSVAETPEYITVEYDDPATTLPAEAAFRASVTYSADDFEFIN